MASRAAYMRDYRKSSSKVMRFREFRRGVEAMRTAAQQMFRAQIGEGTMDGYTAANLLSMLNPSEPVRDADFISARSSEDIRLMQGDGFQTEESSGDDDHNAAGKIGAA